MVHKQPTVIKFVIKLAMKLAIKNRAKVVQKLSKYCKSRRIQSS